MECKVFQYSQRYEQSSSQPERAQLVDPKGLQDALNKWLREELVGKEIVFQSTSTAAVFPHFFLDAQLTTTIIIWYK